MEDELLEKFLESLKIKGYRQATVYEYNWNLNDYTEYLYSVPVYSFFAATVEFATDYYLAVKERKYADKTTWKKQHAVFSFYEWLKKEGLLLVNPFQRPVLACTNKLPRNIPAHETLSKTYEKLSSSEKLYEQRDYVMIDLAYACGLRRCELNNLDIEDIDEGAGVVRVRGKGGRERVVPIGPNSLKDLLHYIYAIRPKLISDSTTRALFVTWQRGGSRMHPWSINAVFRRLRKKYDLDRSLTPHALRHAFATDLVKAGAPVQDVSLMLGHAKLETTQVYTRLAAKDLKYHHAAHHPRA